MGTKLQVDGETLASLATNLGTIYRRLEASKTDADTVAGIVHHERLSATLSDFSSQWERRRIELTEQVDVLKQQAQAAADAFQEVDTELACAIEGE